MVIVITGAVYSGRTTMARAVLDSVPSAVQVPIVTTRDAAFIAKEKLEYRSVSPSDFLEMSSRGEFIGVSSYGGESYAISYTDLISRMRHDNPAVVMCGAETALHIGRELRDKGVPGVCVYMHCSVKAMLFRMAALGDSQGHDDHAIVHDIYGNHAINYNNLHMDADSNSGFIRVIPVNSDSMSDRSYPEKVVAPLAELLKSYSGTDSILNLSSTV